MKNNIAYFMKQKHMSQREFSEKLGTTEVSVSRYIKGEREPKATLAVRMAKILSCTVEELFSPEEQLTEEDAVKVLENVSIENDIHAAVRVAVTALKDIQSYRELGTVEEIKAAMKYLRLAKKHGTTGKVIV